MPGKHKNVVLSLTLPDSSTYTFGRDVNLLWKHGILAEKLPSGKTGGRIDVEEGRISIIAWGERTLTPKPNPNPNPDPDPDPNSNHNTLTLTLTLTLTP